MQKIRKFISALMAGMTLFSMAPVNAGTYNDSSVEDEVTQTEAPENSENQGGIDNLLSWIGNLFLPQVFAAEDDIASGTSGGVTWVIDAEGTLTLSPTNGESGMMENLPERYNGSPWYNYRMQIKKAVSELGVSLNSYACYLFYMCSNLTEINLENLNTNNATDMSSMFQGCESLNSLEPLSKWNISNVTDVRYMFCKCNSLTSLEPLENWETDNVTDMCGVFSSCSSLISLEPLAGWKTDNAIIMSHMFSNCSSLASLNGLAQWNTSNVEEMNGMFGGCSSLTSLEGLAGWKTTNVTNMSALFSGNENLFSLEALSYWDISNVRNMRNMFYGCSSLTSLDPVVKWNTSSATDMSYMFAECNSIASLEPLAGWNVANVTDMSSMFKECENLTSLDGAEDWNTKNMTTISSMFSYCSSLDSLEPLTEWKTNNVTKMNSMFYECGGIISLEPLSKWDISNVEDMEHMFYKCSNARVADFSNWKMAPKNESMFEFCANLSQIKVPSNFNFSNTDLPYPKKTTAYTGKWAYEDPWNHTKTLTGKEFSNRAPEAGTWYWERKGESPLRQHYTAKMNNVFVPEYTENSDGSTILKQTPEEVFSTDGYWQQSDDNTWTYTFYVYDASVKWYVWEEPVPDGYTSTATRENPIIIENGSIVPTITNTLDTMPKDYGKISIQKQLINPSEISQQSDTSFPFKVTIADENNQQLTGAKVFGGVTFQNGVAYLSVKPDETVTISNIPAGCHYTVEELPDDKYVQEITNSSGIVQAEYRENIMLNNNPAGLVVATNTRIQEEERPHENLVIRKEVTGNVETEEAFEFIVALNNLETDTEYTYGNQTFTSDEEGNANVSVSLKNGEEVVFENLPAGTRYRILEEAGNYISSYVISDKNNMGMINQTTDENEATNEELTTAMESVDAGEDVTVTFTNNIMKTQNISISKVVKDAEGQVLTDDSRYEFTVEFSNTEPGTEIQSDLGILRTDDNGQVAASFYLANGETVKFNDIPVGTQYRFTESENSATASYKITDTLENQNTVTAEDANDKPKQELSTSMETVDNGEDAQITFTNTISNGSLTITKKDTNGEPLMGAEFRLTDNDGTVYPSTTTATDSEGIITWTELPFGTYTLTETKAPAGASLMKEPLTIEITSETPDVKISITDNSAIYLDAGGTGMVMGITFSSAALALALACILNDYRKKKYSK